MDSQEVELRGAGGSGGGAQASFRCSLPPNSGFGPRRGVGGAGTGGGAQASFTHSQVPNRPLTATGPLPWD